MVSEADVETFLSKLKSADADKKVDHVQFFGLQLEDASELPESTLDPLIVQVPSLLKSTSHLLIAATLTSLLPFFLPHLPTEAPAPHLRLALLQILPLLLEKLNDPKERVHSAAATALTLLGKKCYEAEPAALGSSSTKGKTREGLVEIWERGIKDVLGGKGWRAKVEGMKVLLKMRAEMGPKLPLKPWLPPLVGLLEDGDGNVREQAKETVIALLSPANTPPAARSEMTKLLAARNVRKTISDSITARIFAGSTSTAVEENGAVDDGAFSSMNGNRSGAATPAVDDVDPVYIAVSRDIESEFAKMLPHFAGKENEHNWLPREKAIIRVRGMLRGKAFERYPEAFVAGLKSGMMEGMSRTLLSLRTTVAQQSCAVVQELAEHLKAALNPFVEDLLGVLGKMAGFTKKIIADKSQKAVSAIITYSSAHPRIFISHISAGIHEKNVQTRHACVGHLKTYLDSHGAHAKAQIDSTPGLEEQVEEALKKGLTDVNPQVRELARGAFWSFHGLWTPRAATIMNSMDNMARKQLDKARTGSSNGLVPSAKPPAAPRASSAMSQLLAEKRKARAAELAAGKGQESPRVVSSPVPASPSIPQGLPRSSSSTAIASSALPGPLSHSVQPSEGSPVSSPTRVPEPSSASSRSMPARTRQGALSRAMSNSPPSSRGSPIGRASPLRSNHNVAETLISPSSSSSTSVGQVLQTPTLPRKPLPTSLSRSPVGLGINGHPEHQLTPEQQNKIAEAEAAVQHLESFPDSDRPPQGPLTPMRPLQAPASGSQLLRTPINGGARHIWDDSPRPEALTPLILDKLKERRHERSWWLKRQQLLDKASPLKSSTPSPTSSVSDDLRALQEGRPEMRNLQKLALFSSSHPISIPSAAIDSDDIAEETRIWEVDQLFERVYNGLAAFLQPTQPFDLLEQGLVVLWELVQHQWSLFDEYSSGLCLVLFRLRTCRSSIILESTNSLISLLAEVSDPVFLFTELRTALDSYLQQHTDESLSASTAELSLASSTNSRNDETGSSNVCTGEQARASGFLFGLNAMGMCILKMPKQVVQNEAAHLGPLVMSAMASPTTTTRQAANTLILAIQCVLRDAQATLSLFPDLNAGQKDLATYLMDKNGLLSPEGGSGGESGAASGVMGEMTDLMARGSRIASS